MNCAHGNCLSHICRPRSMLGVRQLVVLQSADCAEGGEARCSECGTAATANHVDQHQRSHHHRW